MKTNTKKKSAKKTTKKKSAKKATKKKSAKKATKKKPKFWRNNKSQYHREDGPAIVWADGTKEWWLDGKTMSEEEWKTTVAAKSSTCTTDEDGTKRWYNTEGELHREDGPAYEWSDGDNSWYLNGKHHRVGGPAVEFANGDKEWWIDDKPHREDGPAIEYVDGREEWWLDGKELAYTDWLAAVAVPPSLEPPCASAETDTAEHSSCGLSPDGHSPEPPCPKSLSHHWSTGPGHGEMICITCKIISYSNHRGKARFRLPEEEKALEKFEGIPHTDPLIGGTMKQIEDLLVQDELTLRVYSKVGTMAAAAEKIVGALYGSGSDDFDKERRFSHIRFGGTGNDLPSRATSSKALDRNDAFVQGIQCQFLGLIRVKKVTTDTFSKMAALADYALVALGQLDDRGLTVDPDDIPTTPSGLNFSTPETFGAKTLRDMFGGLKPKKSLVRIVDAIAKAKEHGLEEAETALMEELKEQMKQ